MFDRSTITIPSQGVPILPVVISDPEGFATANHFPDFSLKFAYRHREDKLSLHVRTARIELLPHEELVVNLRQVGEHWYLVKITFTAPKFIWGHNAQIVSMPEQLILCLARLRDMVGRLVGSRHIELIVPGEAKQGCSYWSALEIPFHLPDPDDHLFKAFSSMKHRSIRTKSAVYKGESHSLSGKHLGFIAYRKDIEMADRYKNLEVNDKILRLELKLRSGLVAEFFDKSCCKEIYGKLRLVRFTINDLYTAFRKFADGLIGVYCQPSAVDTPTSGIAMFLAKLEARTDLRIKELCGMYQEAKGCNPATVCKLERDALKLRESMSELTADVLFSKERFDNQPGIEIPRIEGRLEGLVIQSANELIHLPELCAAYAPRVAGFVPYSNFIY